MDMKVGDIIWSNHPNCCEESLGGEKGFTGELLEIDKTHYKISVDVKKYPDYNGSGEYKPGYKYVYVYCYGLFPIKLENNTYDIWI